MEHLQHYVCVNPRCRCEVAVLRPSIDKRGNFKCACGREMKKPYSEPIFHEFPSQPPEFGFVKKKKRGA